MSPIEFLLSKIAIAIFNKAVIAPSIAKPFMVFSAFELYADIANCVQTSNDCNELRVCGLKVVSNRLPDAIIDRLISVGNESFEVTPTASGLFVASRFSPPFAATPQDFPRFASSVNDFPTIT